jgi:hypothetical protein
LVNYSNEKEEDNAEKEISIYEGNDERGRERK